MWMKIELRIIFLIYLMKCRYLTTVDENRVANYILEFFNDYEIKIPVSDIYFPSNENGYLQLRAIPDLTFFKILNKSSNHLIIKKKYRRL